ncbi:MAG: hypothetical protein NW201_08445 [Gemmatimonadales bacterium]|nr:hypothetical protein [Gemmatimonadales bacterium]
MQIISLFGKDTGIHKLRGGLEEQMATERGIAGRIADASRASTEQGFAGTFEQKLAAQRRQDVDLQVEMAALADTQIRYEASAKMLAGAYAKLRDAIRNHG